jgi:hypothetical protein
MKVYCKNNVFYSEVEGVNGYNLKIGIYNLGECPKHLSSGNETIWIRHDDGKNIPHESKHFISIESYRDSILNNLLEK